MKNKNVINKAGYLFFKRLIDICIACVLLVLLSPIFVIIACAIRLDSPGNIFFLHKRVGRNGKRIGIYKFRTMVENAEDIISRFTEEQRKEWEHNFKLEEDFRITKIGNFLRKTSLDELPQIVNIIKGDMSFVGPRPVTDEELKWYGNNVDRLLSVLPGLTGYWAVNGRSEVAYPKRCDLELYYVEHCSFTLDVHIFLTTFTTVLKKRGAK